MSDNFKECILHRCCELAMRARGQTATNPNVGAVIVDHTHSRILAEDWHRSFGSPHAEVNAIQKASQKYSLKGKSIAVSLEPCNHVGKTPPCTRSIQDHQITQLWVDQIDPNPRMSGQSIDILRQSGIDVPTPINSAAGKEVLHPFRIGIQLKRPYLRLKMAISRDHFIGKPDKRVKISNAMSNRWVHRIRSNTQAIMVGTNTLLMDDPALTSRYGNRYQPLRILPDRNGILPDNLQVFTQSGENIVLTISARRDYKAKVIHCDPHDLAATFHNLYQNNIGSVLIEGGSRLFKSLFEARLWDELIIIQNNELLLESGIAAPALPIITPDRKIKLGNDIINFTLNPESR